MQNRVLRLLIVDDLEKWRYSLRRQFKHRPDILVTESIDAEDAVEKVKVQDFDLILLDLKMPSDREGLQALSTIKEIKPTTQIIMMSAYGDIPKTVEAINRGALDFVSKESNFDEVLAFKVDEFIRKTSLIADRELLIRAKYEETKRAKRSQSKGKALENLLASILSSVEGFIEIRRDVKTATEEIDLVFHNASRDPFWQKQSEIIMVECKNWHSQRVGKNELVAFREKMENRYGRCKLGFLVCTERFARTVKTEILRSSKTEYLIVQIDGRDLQNLVETDDRSSLLRKYIERAILT